MVGIPILEQFRVTDHVISIGDTQCGKTLTAASFARIQNKFGMTSIIINTKGDKKFYDYEGLGRGFAKYKDVPVDVMRYLLDNYTTDGIIEIRPDIEQGNLVKQIEPFIQEVIYYKKRNHEHEVLFCIDEIHMYQSKMSINDNLKAIWTLGKGLKLYAMGISQRPTNIHNDLWTQSEWFFLHALNQRDLKYLYDNRYLSIPHSWVLPMSDSLCDYPFKDKSSYPCFLQTSKLDGLQEIKVKKFNV